MGLAVALVSAILASILSVWLVLIGWSLLGDAVSHAVVPGVVISFLLGIPLLIGALASALLAVVLIGVVRQDKRIREDTAIGVVFTTLFAIGLVLISTIESSIDLEAILFGDLGSVQIAELLQVIVIAVLVISVLVVKRRDLTLFAFDATHAAIIGLNTKLLAGIMLVSLAFTAVVSMQAVGVILVVAMLITPGATARLFSNSVSKMLLIAPAMAAFSALGGFALGTLTGAASGPLIVIVQGVIFGIVFMLKLVLKTIKTG